MVTPHKPFYWTGDHPEPSPVLKKTLERELDCPVVSDGRYIPARWSPVRRQIAYLRRAVAILLKRRSYRGVFCIQQFIGLYACYFSTVLRISLPPIFLQPFIYVPRQGIFGRLWQHLFCVALRNPSLKIAFCHSQGEIQGYQETFPTAAGKFRLNRFTIAPFPPPTHPAESPYLFAAGTSCRDYATLFAAAGRLPPEFPPIRIACKATDVQNLIPPPNIILHHDLWAKPYAEALAGALAVIVPLRPLPVSAGQIVILQAMSADRPIIVTRTRASGEFVDESCAWLVPPEDPEALATAIRTVLEHPEQAASKARVAQELFNARHTPEAVFKESVAAIAEELSRSP